MFFLALLVHNYSQNFIKFYSDRTHDMWHMVGGSQAITVWDWQCLEDSERKDDLLNELMNWWNI